MTRYLKQAQISVTPQIIQFNSIFNTHINNIIYIRYTNFTFVDKMAEIKYKLLKKTPKNTTEQGGWTDSDMLSTNEQRQILRVFLTFNVDINSQNLKNIWPFKKSRI